jgi:hypothetical protein
MEHSVVKQFKNAHNGTTENGACTLHQIYCSSVDLYITNTRHHSSCNHFRGKKAKRNKNKTTNKTQNSLTYVADAREHCSDARLCENHTGRRVAEERRVGGQVLEHLRLVVC